MFFWLFLIFHLDVQMFSSIQYTNNSLFLNLNNWKICIINVNLSKLDFWFKMICMKCLKIQYIIEMIDFPIQSHIRQVSFFKKYIVLQIAFAIYIGLFSKNDYWRTFIYIAIKDKSRKHKIFDRYAWKCQDYKSEGLCT